MNSRILIPLILKGVASGVCPVGTLRQDLETSRAALKVIAVGARALFWASVPALLYGSFLYILLPPHSGDTLALAAAGLICGVVAQMGLDRIRNPGWLSDELPSFLKVIQEDIPPEETVFFMLDVTPVESAAHLDNPEDAASIRCWRYRKTALHLEARLADGTGLLVQRVEQATARARMGGRLGTKPKLKTKTAARNRVLLRFDSRVYQRVKGSPLPPAFDATRN